MLVIARKNKESIVLDGGICITLLDIRNEQVKLGVEAPRNVRVLRAELLAEVSLRNHSALCLQPSLLKSLGWLPGAAEPQPEVYLELETADLEASSQTYFQQGFQLRFRDPTRVWLERSQTYICLRLAAEPKEQLRLITRP